MHSLILALALWTTDPGAPPAARESAVWYDIGHRLVVRIAELRLTPSTAAAVRDILRGQDLAEASFWADRIRRRRPSTPLHFVNIPLDAETYVPEQHCPDGRCIIAEIQKDQRILADSTASRAQRAEALRFLIHLIADGHQPLHVSNNDDRGGNLRRVLFFGVSRNLHQVWDGDLIQATGLDKSRYLDRLGDRMGSLDLAALEAGTVVDWAMESHRIAADDVYRMPRSGRLGDAYLRANLPLVDLALITAGVRLAKVLNDVFGEPADGTDKADRTDR
jgi:hypothetical protein